MIMSVVRTIDYLRVHWESVSHLQGKDQTLHGHQERDEHLCFRI